jgi:hypothetical protein
LRLRPRVVAFTTVFVVGIVVTFVLLDVTVMGTLLGKVTLPNMGTVKAMGVGVYWDISCNNQVTSIDWGVVQPGATKDVTVYIRNEGNTPAILSLATENWNPSLAASYMSVSWDYSGQIIEVGAAFQVKLSLSVSDGIDGITNFSFDVVITGTD